MNEPRLNHEGHEMKLEDLVEIGPGMIGNIIGFDSGNAIVKYERDGECATYAPTELFILPEQAYSRFVVQ